MILEFEEAFKFQSKNTRSKLEKLKFYGKTDEIWPSIVIWSSATRINNDRNRTKAQTYSFILAPANLWNGNATTPFGRFSGEHLTNPR